MRETCVQAYAHQEFPFEELARQLERERGVPRAVLSRVMIVWQGALELAPEVGAPSLSLLELDQAWLAPESVATTFDLVLDLRENSIGLSGLCFYNSSLFDDGTVRRLLADWELVLERMIKHPDQSVTPQQN